MKNIVMSLFMIMALMVGCGNESSNSINGKTASGLKIARDNSLKEVVKPFHSYKIKVLTDKTIGEDDVSNDTIAVYGEVDGQNTAALLKLNSNYPIGAKIVVEVFDSEDDVLIGKSTPQVYNGKVVNFGVIELK